MRSERVPEWGSLGFASLGNVDFRLQAESIASLQADQARSIRSFSDYQNKIIRELKRFEPTIEPISPLETPPVSLESNNKARLDDSLLLSSSSSSEDPLEEASPVNDALFNLSLQTGLSLFFALLQQDWRRSEANNLSLSVLSTASNLLLSFPPLSLLRVGSLGETALESVGSFLSSSALSTPSAARPCIDLLLSLAVQRGRCSDLLGWINTALSLSGEEASSHITLPITTVNKALSLTQGELFNQEEEVPLKEAAFRLTEQIIQFSSKRNDDVYIWGGGSSLPSKWDQIEDARKIEIGFASSYLLHSDGKVSLLNETTGAWSSISFLHCHIVDLSISKDNDSFALALGKDGKVFSWGNGSHGRLGNGEKKDISHPKEILSLPPVASISAGHHHAGAVSMEGHLYTWGEGSLGRLGHKDGILHFVPTVVRGIQNIGSVSCGAQHTLALSKDGTQVWSFGCGNDGELGHGDSGCVYTPKRIQFFEGITLTKVIASNRFSIALSTTGDLWTWGKTPWNTFSSVPKCVSSLPVVKDVSTGGSHILALTEGKSVYSWGLNFSGNCGSGLPTAKVKHPRRLDIFDIEQISAGPLKSVAWTIPKGKACFHWPYSKEPDTKTFREISMILNDFGLEERKSLEDDEFEEFLLSIFTLLLSFFEAAPSLSGRQDWKTERINLEDTLFKLLDRDHLSENIVSWVRKCIQAGSPFLQPLPKDRVKRCYKLLKQNTISQGQMQKLKMDLESLEAQGVISGLIADNKDGKETVQKLLEHLISKMHHDFLASLKEDSSYMMPLEMKLGYSIHLQYLTTLGKLKDFSDLRQYVNEVVTLGESLIDSFIQTGATELNLSSVVDHKFLAVFESTLLFLIKNPTYIPKSVHRLRDLSLRVNCALNDTSSFLMDVHVYVSILSSSVIGGQIRYFKPRESSILQMCCHPFFKQLSPSPSIYKSRHTISNYFEEVKNIVCSEMSTTSHEPLSTLLSLSKSHLSGSYLESIQVVFIHDYVDSVQSLLLDLEGAQVSSLNAKILHSILFRAFSKLAFDCGESHDDDIHPSICSLLDYLLQFINIEESEDINIENYWKLFFVGLLLNFLEYSETSPSEESFSRQILNFKTMVPIILRTDYPSIEDILSFFESIHLHKKKLLDNVPIAEELLSEVSSMDLKHGFHEAGIQIVGELLGVAPVCSLEDDPQPQTDKIYNSYRYNSNRGCLGRKLAQLIQSLAKDPPKIFDFEEYWTLVVCCLSNEVYNLESVKLVLCNDFLNSLRELLSHNISFSLRSSILRLVFQSVLVSRNVDSSLLNESASDKISLIIQDQLKDASNPRKLTSDLVNFICILTSAIDQSVPSYLSRFKFNYWINGLLECLEGRSDVLEISALRCLGKILSSFEVGRNLETIIRKLFSYIHDSYWNNSSKSLLDPTNPHGSSSSHITPMEFNLENSYHCILQDSRTILSSGEILGYCMTNRFVGSGLVYWTVSILKDSKGSDGVALGVSPAAISSRSTKDMWLYSSSGQLAHKDRTYNAHLPSFAKGDTILCILNKDDCSLCFSKNGGPSYMGFCDLPRSVELCPVVAFSATKAKMSISHLYERKPDHSPFYWTEPHLTPVGIACSQEAVDVLRNLYNGQSPIWKSAIDTFSRNAFLKSEGLIKDLVILFNGDSLKESKECLALVDDILKNFYPILALMSNTDSGIRLGSTVCNREAETGIIVGMSWAESLNVKVRWSKDGSFSFRSTHCLALVEKPDEGVLNRSFSNKYASELIDVLLILYTFSEKLSLNAFGVYSVEEEGAPRQRSSTSEAVELMTDSLVNSIIDEVTGKSEPVLKEKTGEGSQADNRTKKGLIQYEAFFKIIALQFSSVKSLISLALKQDCNRMSSFFNSLQFLEAVSAIERMSLPSFNISLSRHVHIAEIERTLSFLSAFRSNHPSSEKLGSVPFPSLEPSFQPSELDTTNTTSTLNTSLNSSDIRCYFSSRRSSLNDAAFNLPPNNARRTFRSDLLKVNPNIFLIDHLKNIFDCNEEAESEVNNIDDLTWLGPISVKADPLGQHVLKLGFNDPASSSLMDIPESLNNKLCLQYSSFLSHSAKLEEMFYSLEYLKKIIQIKCTQELLLAFYRSPSKVPHSSVTDISFCYPFLFEFARMNGLHSPLEGLFFKNGKELRSGSGPENEVLKVMKARIRADVSSFIALTNICVKNLRNLSEGEHVLSQNERVAIYITQILTEMVVSVLYDESIEISGHLSSAEESPKHGSSSSTFMQTTTKNMAATRVIDALSSVVLSRRLSDLDSLTNFKTWAIKLIIKVLGSHLPPHKIPVNHSDILGALPNELHSLQMNGHAHKIVSMDSFQGTLATGSCDGTIRLWRNDECLRILILDPQEEISVMSDQILSWSPSGKYLVLAIGSMLHVWEIEDSEGSHHQLPQLSHISALCWSSNPDNEILLAARQNGTITAVSTSLLRTEELNELHKTKATIRCLVALSDSDQSFLISYSDGLIRRFVIHELEVLILREFSFSSPKLIHVQGDYLAFYSTNEKGFKILNGEETCLSLSSTSETGFISAFSWSFDSVYAAIGHDSGDILIIQMDQNNEPLTLNSSQPVSHLCFHKTDPNILVSGSSKSPSGFVNIWSLLSKTVIRTLIGSGGVTCLKWINRKSLAVGFCNSENVTVINLPAEMDNIIIASGIRSVLLGHLPYETLAPHFKVFINKFDSFITEQYEYEKLCIAEGFQLIYTQFLQNLSFLAYVLDLNDIFRSLPGTRWKWLFNYTNSMTILRLLNKRNPEGDQQLLRLLLPDLSNDKETQSTAWTPESDSYLMKWYTGNPSDWQPGGKSSVYLFGNGENGQLAELGSSSPQPKLGSSFGGSSSVICGLDVTFALQPNGHLYACGDGLHGKLGLGNSEDHSSLTPMSSLRGFVVTQVATSVLGGSGHTLAVTQSGEVFSWGDGEDGKLGHGNTERCRRPKIISSLSGHFATYVAVGSSHSAVLTDKGRVFTFGCGDRGRLGHGNFQTKKVPEVISSLRGYFVTHVACGLEHTLCLTRHNGAVHVWSFGDGEYGKLGNGLCCFKSVPKKINYTWKDPVIKVSLGTTFSLFLTSGGEVLFCGSYKFFQNASVHTPKKITQFVNIVDIAVGGNRILALSKTGEVWGWGYNFFGESDSIYKEPSVIPDLSDKEILQISVGRSHSAVWTAPPTPYGCDGEQPSSSRRGNIGVPNSIPNEFQVFLPTDSSELCWKRLNLLHEMYNYISEVWRLFPVLDRDLSSPPRVADFHLAMRDDAVRESLSPLVATLPLMQTLMATMTSSNVLRNYGPQVTVRRLFPIGSSSIFSQIAEQVYYIDPQELRLPYRSWKVKLVGEAADDAGGVFDDTITEMCSEITKESLNLLVLTPNGTSDTGANRDKYILNSDRTSRTDLRHFWFLGILCGVALRTRKPIAINLAPFIWKLMIEVKITWKDLEEVDLLYTRSLRYISSSPDTEEEEDDASSLFPTEFFTGISFSGKEVPLFPGSQKIRLTRENKEEYVEAAFHQRVNEMMPQILAMRKGLAALAPYPILKLLPSQTLESLICGESSFPLWILKKIARYRDLDPCNEVIVWLWEILEEFSNDLKILFLIFVCGRSRLPTQAFDVSQRFQILRVQRPENGLPTAQTCFFQLRLPPYTSKEIMRSKLIYAIKHCRTIDMDSYMLTRNNELRIN